MAVKITDLCINCDSCIDECPATAISNADNSPLSEGEFCYVSPEKCIECVDGTMPKCADICPTEGAIVWDMPYTKAFNEYFVQGHDEGTYKIRIHKKKNLLMTPNAKEMPFRESISMEIRTSHGSVLA